MYTELIRIQQQIYKYGGYHIDGFPRYLYSVDFADINSFVKFNSLNIKVHNS